MLLWLAACAGPAAAAERLALVIGNGAYPSSPLRNPGNDARARAELLRRAGFDVELRTDTTRGELLQGISRFGQSLRDPSVRIAVFYYAGHGFQQEWRNYLVPVDARVQNGADVSRQTVEVGELIRQMNAAQARGRSFLVILDACRDDPFAGTWRPPAKGLIPFDAPVGSMLAYATAPGRVAIDGVQGGNGLYTKHLLRELAVADASVEDAFKRVRLAVRVESQGRQVPWEMASLEDSLYLFPQARKSLGDAERQQRFDAELLAWNRVRQGSNTAELVEFLRTFPSGNASELAQARLNRLLADETRRIAEAERAAAAERAAQRVADQLLPPAAAAAPRPSIAAAPPTLPAAVSPSPGAEAGGPGAGSAARPVTAPVAVTDAAAAVDAPTQLPSTPFFSGQSEHRRDYRVGQRFDFRLVDGFSSTQRSTSSLRVTAIDAGADRVEFNGGEFISDLMGNTLANPRGAMSTPRQFYPADLVLGKRWQTEFKQARPSGLVYTFRYQVKVAAKEPITVPAGRFEAWRIEAEGFNVDLGAQIRRTIWIAPGVPADLAVETFVRLRNGQIEQHDRQELVAVHQP